LGASKKPMRILLIILFLKVKFFCYGQDKLEKVYSDHFGEKLEFIDDSTFMHTWNFDLAGSWTRGVWEISNDTIYLKTLLVKDTLTIRNSIGKVLKDSLVLSGDEIPNRIENEEFLMSLISGGGQNRRLPPDRLYIKSGKLFRILENGNIDRTKSERILSKKKYKTYFKPQKN